MPEATNSRGDPCEQLRELVERRQASEAACRRLALIAKTTEDRIVYEEMARRIAEEATALKWRMLAWQQLADHVNGPSGLDLVDGSDNGPTGRGKDEMRAP